jgi:hypothetical protein
VEDRSEYFGDLVNCTYCTSHWVAFFYAALGTQAIAARLHVVGHMVSVWFVLAMTLVAISSPIQWVIYYAHKNMKREEY